jgi:hypothetical protein
MHGERTLNGVISSNSAMKVGFMIVAVGCLYSPPSCRQGVNHNISQDGRVAILTVHQQPFANPRFPLNLLKYFGFPSHHVNFIMALFADFVHIFLLSLDGY